LQPGFGVTVLSSVVSPSLKKPFLAALSRAIAIRDLATFEHAERVRRYATALARQAGVVEESLLQAIDAAALLHDVGKLAIPDGLLDKPGPLTADEYNRVKEHAAIGADLLAEVAFPGPLAALVRHHHENWDGSGYPDGQSGTEIPLGARVLAIADCYDALTSHRPYRRALNHDSAIAMIHERRGSMFDPDLTDAFLQVVWQLRPSSPAIYRPTTARRVAARALVLVGAR
jgi:putative nucleotidyltransferase with HDIG domain